MFSKSAIRILAVALLLSLSGCAMQGGGKLEWDEDPANFSVDRVPHERHAQLDYETPIRPRRVA